MYPHSFEYHRVGSLKDAIKRMKDLGEEARLIAGGQSLIPLMKMRLARPAALVDINHIPGIAGIERRGDELRIGALARHAEIEASSVAAAIPIVHDCAAGIADVQVRNMGTIGGSVAEADPSGDWGATLLTLETRVVCEGPNGERTVPLEEFVKDAYTTVLGHEELVKEIVIQVPPAGSGGACVAFKRSAPVYATASVAVQLTLGDQDTVKDARIVLGCVGLVAIRAQEAEAALRGKRLAEKTLQAVAESARAAADPQSDMRGSAEYKKTLVAALVKRAIGIAARRARGEQVEGGHEYAAR